MLKKISSALPLIFAVNFLLLSFLPSPAKAAGASLFFSPASGQYTVGKTFTVRVMVNSGGGMGINASEAAINFDPALLLVSKATKDNSIFSLWTQDPTFSNKNGTISFGGGAPAAFSGSAGTIINIVFVTKGEGTANVTFSSGMVLAADGKGTDVYSGGGTGTYTIKAAAAQPVTPPEQATTPPSQTTGTGQTPPAPDLTSSSHPDDKKWYPNNKVDVGWHLLGDLTAVSATLDETPTGDPGSKSIGIIDSTSFENVADGVHYVHAKFKNNNGWGQIAHLKVMIDTKAPNPFEITIDNGGDTTNPTPIINFTTTDQGSGIDHYSLTLDNQSEDIAPRDFKAQPYTAKLLYGGNHQVSVVAIDKANNRASSTKSFIVDPLKLPVITEMPKTLNKGEILIVRGTSFYPQAVVTLYLGKDGKEIDAPRANTDADGNWAYFRNKALDNGIYDVWAKITDKRGAESNLTERQGFSVINPSWIQAYAWLIIIILIIIIIILILIIIYQKKKYDEEKKRVQNEIQETKDKMSEVFNALKEEVDELMEMADKKPGLSESEKRVKDKLREALDISEELITKEVTDIEKEAK